MWTIQAVARTATILVGMASTGCAHPALNASATPSRPHTSAEATALPRVALRIESHQSGDIVIYAVRGRMRQRIGTVAGPTTRLFSIPARFMADLGGFYLVAHPVGGGGGTDVSSPTIAVQPGQTVVWTLESDLAHSALAVE